MTGRGNVRGKNIIDNVRTQIIKDLRNKKAYYLGNALECFEGMKELRRNQPGN